MRVLSKVCSHDGCSKLVFSSQVCYLHDGTNVEARPKKKLRADMSTRTISVSKDGAKLRYYKQCTHEGCDNIAKKSGKCYSHGAARKICFINGCTSSSQKCGVCIKHYRTHEEFEPLPLKTKEGGNSICHPEVWTDFVNVFSEIV